MIERVPGRGWLALLGGGEFSFGETEEADRAWLDKSAPGTVGFLPTASGSSDYGRHFAAYLEESFGRRVETIPIYRVRDARRGRNLERIRDAAVLYLGGGVVDELLEVLGGSPALAALAERLEGGVTVAAIAAGAQALGQAAWSLGGGPPAAGLGWLPGGAVEANFTPAHDRRLRRLLELPGVTWGLGLPAGSAVLLGPDGERLHVGRSFGLADRDGDLEVLS